MKWFIFLVFLLAITARPAMADEAFLCTFGQKERLVSLIYTNPEKTLPCDIRYKKDGNTKVLWHSNNTKGYCETKLKDFLKKQVGLGWRCNNVSSHSSIAESYSKPDAEQYLAGSYLANAISMASFFRIYLENNNYNGKFPDSVQAMGIDPADLKTSSYFSDIVLGKNGVFYIKGNKKMGTGSIIKQTPKITLGGGGIEWECVTNMNFFTIVDICEYDESLKIE